MLRVCFIRIEFKKKEIAPKKKGECAHENANANASANATMRMTPHLNHQTKNAHIIRTTHYWSAQVPRTDRTKSGTHIHRSVYTAMQFPIATEARFRSSCSWSKRKRVHRASTQHSYPHTLKVCVNSYSNKEQRECTMWHWFRLLEKCIALRNWLSVVIKRTMKLYDR